MGHRPPPPFLDCDGSGQQFLLKQSAAVLRTAYRDLQEAAWILMRVLDQHEERNIIPGLNPMRSISNDLWFLLSEIAPEVPKAIMRFGVQEDRKEPGYVKNISQYFRSFQITLPPKNTIKGRRST